MPCNLAVSITKAAVTPDHLRELVTPEVIQTVLTSFLADQYPGYTIQVRPGMQYALEVNLLASLPATGNPHFSVSITQDWVITTKVIAYGYATMGDEAKANQLTDQIHHLLARTADAVFARRVQGALANLGGQLAIETVLVEEAGQSASATLMTITL